jgi:hypothetical protein
MPVNPELTVKSTPENPRLSVVRNPAHLYLDTDLSICLRYPIQKTITGKAKALLHHDKRIA